ncbi:hypothetical protein VTK73DRAFT_6452 [Phialemonium thermophilum]|uniref:Uncharacterized protein n=1 Tax=Phialemonium thermophilum TaxID=223376 RepID=A0ABR3V0U9_9PEZI
MGSRLGDAEVCAAPRMSPRPSSDSESTSSSRAACDRGIGCREAIRLNVGRCGSVQLPICLCSAHRIQDQEGLSRRFLFVPHVNKGIARRDWLVLSIRSGDQLRSMIS